MMTGKPIPAVPDKVNLQDHWVKWKVPTNRFRNRNYHREEEPLDEHIIEDSRSSYSKQRVIRRRQTLVAEEEERLVDDPDALNRAPSDNNEDTGEHGTRHESPD